MNKSKVKRAAVITERLICTVVRRLGENKQLRRTLPQNGRVHIDRQLPFLCVYRHPPGHADKWTALLVKGEASYLVASGGSRLRTGLRELVHAIAATLGEQFGAFLIVEVWATPTGAEAYDPTVPKVLPAFRVLAPDTAGATTTVEAIVAGLQKTRILKQGVAVDVAWGGVPHPPGLRPLLSADEAEQLNVTTLGVEVPQVYRNVRTGDEFPTVLRSLRRSLGLALRRGFFEFANSCTTHRPHHYHALGRTAVVKAVWRVDEQLAEVSNSFDYLLQLTPVNSRAAWNEFRRTKFQRMPEFRYRPLPMDPGLQKRKLFSIPLEQIEDPALHDLFFQKQDELQRKITMLEDRDTPRFLYGSMQLFGTVEEPLLDLALELLERTPTGSPRGTKREVLTAEQFAARARQEFVHYRRTCPDFAAKAVVTGDVSGILVSRGRLLIASDTKVSPPRVKALLAHEIGTHLVTYYNGRAQPFRQLYSGLAGYEELQEGLAVLSEYLAGGLSRARLRQLAARVVAARMMIDGATFVETFRMLEHTHRFRQRSAFNITMRVFRGGGLTKDAVYLRGLQQMLKYVQNGGELQPLLVGKIAEEHIPVIRELRLREVLKPPPASPRYLEQAEATRRLAFLRAGNGTVFALAEGPKKRSKED